MNKFGQLWGDTEGVVGEGLSGDRGCAFSYPHQVLRTIKMDSLVQEKAAPARVDRVRGMRLM